MLTLPVIGDRNLRFTDKHLVKVALEADDWGNFSFADVFDGTV